MLVDGLKYSFSRTTHRTSNFKDAKQRYKKLREGVSSISPHYLVPLRDKFYRRHNYNNVI